MGLAGHVAENAVNRRVLVVEDDDDLRESISDLLMEAGYSVDLCKDGKDALRKIRAAPHDLIILDLLLPQMDGWEFRAAQRADRSVSEIPVIVISGEDSPQATTIHANVFMRKPFDADDLIQTVERVLLTHDRMRLALYEAETQRLALLNTIAAGVGREMNDPLSSAMGSLQLAGDALLRLRENFTLLQQTPGTGYPATIFPGIDRRLSSLDAHLRDARAGLERANLIAKNLQYLPRPLDDQRSSVRLTDVIEGAVAIAMSQINHRATLVRSYDSSITVLACESRLRQVMLNLLVNAAQAIPPGQVQKHRISIKTRRVQNTAVIEVSDTGVGISEALMERVFEPFFTTTGEGEGTGLGLSICKQIVESHRGTIELQSELDRGAMFRVRLPLESNAGTSSPVHSGTEKVGPDSATRACVWVLDDERLLANSMSRVLEDLYDVVLPQNAREVLERLAIGERFDVLVCDIMMPSMNGMELHERVSESWPELARRMVFVSGGAFADAAMEFAESVALRCLAKPFTGADLRELVARALG